MFGQDLCFSTAPFMLLSGLSLFIYARQRRTVPLGRHSGTAARASSARPPTRRRARRLTWSAAGGVAGGSGSSVEDSETPNLSNATFVQRRINLDLFI